VTCSVCRKKQTISEHLDEMDATEGTGYICRLCPTFLCAVCDHSIGKREKSDPVVEKFFWDKVECDDCSKVYCYECPGADNSEFCFECGVTTCHSCLQTSAKFFKKCTSCDETYCASCIGEREMETNFLCEKCDKNKLKL